MRAHRSSGITQSSWKSFMHARLFVWIQVIEGDYIFCVWLDFLWSRLNICPIQNPTKHGIPSTMVDVAFFFLDQMESEDVALLIPFTSTLFF